MNLDLDVLEKLEASNRAMAEFEEAAKAGEKVSQRSNRTLRALLGGETLGKVGKKYTWLLWADSRSSHQF